MIKDIRKPCHGEKIFFVNTFGVVDECIFDSTEPMSWKLVDCGNFYFSYKDAEYASMAEKYRRLYSKYINEYNDFCDWSNDKQVKWFGCWDMALNDVRVSGGSTIKLGCEYASSKKIINEAVEFIDKENFKKYITGTMERDILWNNNIFDDFELDNDFEYELINEDVDDEDE